MFVLNFCYWLDGNLSWIMTNGKMTTWEWNCTFLKWLSNGMSLTWFGIILCKLCIFEDELADFSLCNSTWIFVSIHVIWSGFMCQIGTRFKPLDVSFVMVCLNCKLDCWCERYTFLKSIYRLTLNWNRWECLRMWTWIRCLVSRVILVQNMSNWCLF